MTTWREKAKKYRNVQSEELTKLPKAPFVSFGSESPGDIPEFFEVGEPANEPAAMTARSAQVTCETCRHFRPDQINPPAGVGICAAGVGHLSIGRALHPMAPRYCAGHEVAG